MLHILVVLSMDKKQKALLESKAPGAVFLYRDQKTVPEEDVKNADIILGNVPEAYLNNASKLRWLQLDSAGSDKYAALPLFREEHARLTNASGCYGLLISEHGRRRPFALRGFSQVQRSADRPCLEGR